MGKGRQLSTLESLQETTISLLEARIDTLTKMLALQGNIISNTHSQMDRMKAAFVMREEALLKSLEHVCKN